MASIKNAFHIFQLILQCTLQHLLKDNELAITLDKQVKAYLLKHSIKIPDQGLIIVDEHKLMVITYTCNKYKASRKCA